MENQENNTTGLHRNGLLTPAGRFTSVTSRMSGWMSRGARRTRARPEISSPSPWAGIRVRTSAVGSKKCNIIITLCIHVSS